MCRTPINDTICDSPCNFETVSVCLFRSPDLCFLRGTVISATSSHFAAFAGYLLRLSFDDNRQNNSIAAHSDVLVASMQQLPCYRRAQCHNFKIFQLILAIIIYIFLTYT